MPFSPKAAYAVKNHARLPAAVALASGGVP